MLIRRYVASDFDIEATENEIKIHACLSSIGTDHYGDRIKEGAFDRWLDESPASLPMMYQHDSADTIGVWRNFNLDGKRLVADGVIYRDIGKATDAVKLLQRGAIKGVSIGFRVDPDKVKFEKRGFVFSEITPHEASIVSVPANPDAEVIAFKKQLENRSKAMSNGNGATDQIEADLEDLKLQMSRLTKSVTRISVAQVTDNQQSDPKFDREFKAVLAKGEGELSTKALLANDWYSQRNRERSYGGNVAVPGSAELGYAPLFKLAAAELQGDVTTFMASLRDPFQANKSTEVDVPLFADISASAEASVDSSRTVQGGLSSTKVTLARYVVETGWSVTSLQVVPGIERGLQEQMRVALVEAIEDVLTKVLTDTLGTGSYANAVKTGVAGTLPTNANFMGVVVKMLAKVKAPYFKMANFYVSDAFREAMYNATSTTAQIAYDPALAADTLFGRPVKALGGLESGGKANDVSCVFLYPARALLLCLSDNVRITSYTKTGGMRNYYADLGIGATIHDPNSITGLVTGA